MSDTGDEHIQTYEHIAFIQSFCQRHDIEFYFLRPADGYHPAGCFGLIPWLKKNSSIMSKAYAKTCTDNLKIRPIYNFLDEYIGRRIYHEDIPYRQSRKGFIKRYVQRHGKINVLLGISAEEKHRLGKPLRTPWMIECIQRVYPLVELGMTRQRCQDWIVAHGLPLPPPSNCMRCPFLSEVELVWLFRFYPAYFHEWVEMERKKVQKCKTAGIPDNRNLGVNGSRMLPEMLRIALEKYGHWTDAALNDYKMSHGHCVRSKY